MIAKKFLFFIMFFLFFVQVSEANDYIVNSFLEGFTGAIGHVISDPVIKTMEKHHKVKIGLAHYDADDDMPPEDHRDMWGRVESKKGNCWVHVKTFKKICDKDQ
jgi:hypothetical protein